MMQRKCKIERHHSYFRKALRADGCCCLVDWKEKGEYMETYFEYCKTLSVTRTQAEVIDAITIMDHRPLMRLSI